MRFFLLSATIRLLSLIPLPVLRVLSGPLGWLSWKLSKTKRNSTIKNLQACYPEMDADSRMHLARMSMRHYVMNILETGMSWYRPLPRLVRLFDAPVGAEHLAHAQAGGRGVMILLPHFGAWEMTSHWLQKDHSLMALYKPGAFPAFDEKLLAMRERYGTRMAPTNRAGLKRIYKHLQEGGTVLVLPDQEPSEGEGRFAPFYGIPALTGVLAPRLVQRTGCGVVFMVCRRTAEGRYQSVFVPASNDLRGGDMDVALAALNDGVTQCIEIDSAQYLWAYKRFRTRPPGAKSIYRPESNPA